MLHNPKQFLSAADPVLGAVIAQLPEPVIASTGLVFHDLLSCVIEQQIHYRSTKKTFEKLLRAAGLEMLTPETFGRFEEQALSRTWLTAAKYETMLRVLQFWDNHPPDWCTLSDLEVRQALGAIKGIGSWTIDMILLYTLQRPDIFPAEDFHLKQVMAALYGLPPGPGQRAQMLRLSGRWSGHRSLAVQYLLAWEAAGMKPLPAVAAARGQASAQLS